MNCFSFFFFNQLELVSVALFATSRALTKPPTPTASDLDFLNFSICFILALFLPASLIMLWFSFFGYKYQALIPASSSIRTLRKIHDKKHGSFQKPKDRNHNGLASEKLVLKASSQFEVAGETQLEEIHRCLWYLIIINIVQPFSFLTC